MNKGSVGFLMNDFREDSLVERLEAAAAQHRPPAADGGARRRRRRPYGAGDQRGLDAAPDLPGGEAARLDRRQGQARASSSPTGVLIATPAGSTAYNLSVNGPILPLNAPLLALTPISAFRPRRWRGALLPDRAQIRIDVIEARAAPGQRRRRPHRVPQRHPRSTSRWTAPSTSSCCTTPATASTSASCASSSAPKA